MIGLQALFMPVIMFSTFFAPLDGTPRWFEVIANLNPFTSILDGARSTLFADTDFTAIGIGVAAFAAIGVVTFTLAGRRYAGLTTPD